MSLEFNYSQFSMFIFTGYGRAGRFSIVTPWSLFRIGSISKSVTAMGILKLLEKAEIKLDSQVFGAAGTQC